MRHLQPTRFAAAFDPFGEPLAAEAACAGASAKGDRMARRVGGAVFWTLALLILAGRIYAAGLPAVEAFAAKTVEIVALR